MGETELQLKTMIIEKYGNLKKFCEIIDMPWTTLDSILKRGVSNANITNIMKITKELNIDTESLASGLIKDNSNSESAEIPSDYVSDTNSLTENDNKDIAKDLENIMNKLSNDEDGPASYDGENIPEDDREMFAAQLEIMLRRLKTINKEKYNPNKNKK